MFFGYEHETLGQGKKHGYNKKKIKKKHKKTVCRLPSKDAQNNKVEVVVHFIDIGKIGDHGDHHCLHFRFKINQ